MSINHQAESSTSALQDEQATSTSSRISIHLPTSFLILPPVAGLIGLGIGMSRGGSQARLRFLAENAHRPPTTYRGWYFYTKTRNYRMLFGALRTGGKFALALSSATLAYVVLDESVGVAREYMVGKKGGSQWREFESEEGIPRRVGWRKGGVWWGDGMIAGGLLGLGVGAIYKLPRPLFIRSTIIGTIMGGTTSALQTVQAKVGQMREAQEKTLPTINNAASASASATGSASADLASIEITPPNTSSTQIDPLQSGSTMSSADVELPQVPIESSSTGTDGWSKLWSWIPGTGTGTSR